LNDDVIVLLTGIRIFLEEFISTAGVRELSAHVLIGVDYSARVIPLFVEFVHAKINSSQNRIQSRQILRSRWLRQRSGRERCATKGL
jgi:hypothetical protein